MRFDFESEYIVAYGQIALSLLIIILLGILFYYLTRRGLVAMGRRGYISVSLQDVLQVMLRWIIVVLVALLGLQQIGIQLTSVWAALSALIVFAGVGLVAVWSVLSNVLCSLLLLMFRPFNIGDKIEITEATGGPGLHGKVVNLNLLYTFILEDGKNETGNNAIAQVPNNTFFQKTIRRWPGANTRYLEESLFEDDTQSIKQNMAL